ncbi:MAG: helix-turn-helix domain-containing protein [Terriglobia bacterium]
MQKTSQQKERKLLIGLLKETRTSLGLTQVDLAGRLGRPQSFVSKYESGERRLDLVELREICTALNVSVEELVIRFERSLR